MFGLKSGNIDTDYFMTKMADISHLFSAKVLEHSRGIPVQNACTIIIDLKKNTT